MPTKALDLKARRKRKEAIGFTLSTLLGFLLVFVAAVGMHLRDHKEPMFGTLEEAPGMKPGEVAAMSSLTDLEGRTVPLFGPASDYVVLSFTSRKCPGCSDEAPVWKTLSREGAAHRTRMFLVSADSNIQDIRRYLAAYDLSGVTTVYDPKGKILESFKIELMPQYLLFDRNGRLIHREVGYSKATGVDPEKRAGRILAAAASVRAGR